MEASTPSSPAPGAPALLVATTITLVLSLAGLVLCNDITTTAFPQVLSRAQELVTAAAAAATADRPRFPGECVSAPTRLPKTIQPHQQPTTIPMAPTSQHGTRLPPALQLHRRAPRPGLPALHPHRAPHDPGHRGPLPSVPGPVPYRPGRRRRPVPHPRRLRRYGGPARQLPLGQRLLPLQRSAAFFQRLGRPGRLS